MIIYNFIKYLILSIRYNSILKKVYNEEHVLEGLSNTLGTEVKQDWIGRAYAVVNPYITDGKYDPSKVITELGKDIPSQMIVEKHIMERINVISMFIKTNNLFDLLTYEIKKIDEYENYLFVLYPLPYVDLIVWGKRFLYLLLAMIAIFVSILIFL